MRISAMLRIKAMAWVCLYAFALLFWSKTGIAAEPASAQPEAKTAKHAEKTPAAPAAATVAAVAAPASEPKKPEDLLKALGELPEWEPVWYLADDLAKPENRELLLKNSTGTAALALRLACGYALLKLGEQKDGSTALENIIHEEQAPLSRRIEAIAACGSEGGEYVTSRVRALLEEKGMPEVLQVELAKALWRLTRGEQAREKLSALLQSASPRVREEAALALATFAPVAETSKLLDALVFKPGITGSRARKLLQKRATEALAQGEFEKVSPLLRKLADHPTLSLDTEDLLLGINGDQYVDNEGSQDKFAIDLMQELIDLTRKNYAVDLSGDEAARKRELDRITSTALAGSAAKAFAMSVDPFTAYLDEADLTEMSEQMGGEYGGIGAWVGMRNGRFSILLPMYGEPAFQAGIKTMDWVEKIDDKDIAETPQKEIIGLLKGAPGSTVKLTVWRRGWNKPHVFSVVRKQINVPSVKSRMLPDGVGYIRLERFGNEDTTVAELSKALRDLRESGMKGLVLDLSNNPGGMLTTAVRVCDKFLPGNKLIVYSQGKPEVHPRKEYYSVSRGTEENYPLVVIVNGSSASASEIVAGALRDHKRATLVGEKTYGKGSVQQLFWLNSSGRRTSMKLTIAKYYLPNGDCIHGKGIEPNIKVKLPELSMASFEARRKVIESLIVSDYVRDTFPRFEKEFRELLTFDQENPQLYPEFDKLAAKVKSEGIEIDSQDLRHEIRIGLVTYLESERGERLVVDIQENAYLQSAVTELRKLMHADAGTVPLYAWYEKKIQAREQEEAEKRAKMYPPPRDGKPLDVEDENGEE